MKPVWINYYGMIPMTKFGYLVALGAAAAVAFVLIVVGLLLEFLPPLSTLWQPDLAMAQRGFGGLVYNYMWWTFIVCLVAQAIDTFVTLRVFAKKEKEQRAELEALEQEERVWQEAQPPPHRAGPKDTGIQRDRRQDADRS